MFCLQSKVKLADCKVYVSSLFPVPDLGLKKAKYLPIEKVFSTIKTYYPILVNQYSFVTPDTFVSCTPNTALLEEVDYPDFYANSNVYPQISFTELNSRIRADKVFLEMLVSQPKTVSTKTKLPLVFMGSRFRFSHATHKELDYVFLLSLIQGQGVFRVKVDSFGSHLLSGVLGSASVAPSFEASESYIDDLGTLISAKGDLECLVNTTAAASQLFDVPKNSIFVMPLGNGDTARLVVKGHGIDLVEKEVEGGSLGLIFDTREDKVATFRDVKLFNAALKSLENSRRSF